MSGKQLGDNHKRRTCICGSLLSKALLDFRLTSTFHQHREQLSNEGRTTTSHPANVKCNTEPGGFIQH